jgi:ubiquinone/menaquinone biosynthesis C-methylase UbiE
MIACIQSNGGLVPEGSRILDFGCGSGRMLRWIPDHVANGEYWGCDTTAKAITWAQAHLGPRFRLFTNLREPHLPFIDRYFDFIYAGSVFSHIDDLADFWLLELRRVLKANSGLLFVTFQDEHSLELISRQNTAATKGYFQRLYDELNINKYIGNSFDKVVVGKTAYTSQVFYDSAWFKTHLEAYFSTVVIIQEAYGWQSGALLSCLG